MPQKEISPKNLISAVFISMTKSNSNKDERNSRPLNYKEENMKTLCRLRMVLFAVSMLNLISPVISLFLMPLIGVIPFTSALIALINLVLSYVIILPFLYSDWPEDIIWKIIKKRQLKKLIAIEKTRRKS